MSPRTPSPRLKRLEELSLADLEALRLILRGDSVVDWHRLSFASEAEAESYVSAQELDLGDPGDVERLRAIQDEAIDYLRANFAFHIPRPIAEASLVELCMMASGKGHRQVCACTVLKVMHIIHHLDARELLFQLPMSSQELFAAVQQKVYRIVGNMLAAGLPITEVIGGSKNRESLLTKLLSKPETSAANVYDKLRFRIVARSVDDLLPILQVMTQELFPFSYVIPGQSTNTIFHFRKYCKSNPQLAAFIPQFQEGIDDEFTPSGNSFSAADYRIMHFVVDMPVRLPTEFLMTLPPMAQRLGPIVFVLCELQLVDQKTEVANERGEASHALYKERQKKAVIRRLKLGSREMRSPPPAPPPVAPPSRRKRSGS